MKKKRLLLVFVLSAVMMFLCSTSVVYAGVSYKVICDSDNFSSGINMGEWYTSDSDIAGTEEGIVFREDLAAGSRIASRTQLYNPQSNPEAQSFRAELRFNFKKAIEGRVVVSFGLRLPNSAIGSANTSAVYFTTQDNRVMLGASNFDAQGQENIILEPIDTGVALNVDGVKLDISLAVSQSGGLVVSVGERTIVSETAAGCAASGYFGAGVTAAGNSFAIEKIRFVGYSNYTPENTNIMENFDRNCYNTMDLRTVVPVSGVGTLLPQNGRLEFSGLSEGFVSTYNRYSNAEIAFDIVSMRRKPVYDGRVLTAPISAGFSVALGCRSNDSVSALAAITFKLIPVGGNNIVSPSATQLEIYLGNEKFDTVLLPRSYNIWNEQTVQGRSIGILIEAKDGTVSFAMRYDNEVGYKCVYSGNFDANPDGFIRISAEGTSAVRTSNLPQNSVKKCDISIDNLSITNTDESAHVVVSEYVASYTQVEDYDYTSTWNNEDMLFFG